MQQRDFIFIKGAKEHNLKNIDLKIPRNSLVVVTGLSGSGKSSLAFDTIYAEGQRRYVESLSAYARQFLEQLQKPNVEYINGLSPAVAIEQRKASVNPRSTVGTTTEIYDYLRLLYARVGTPYCYKCNIPITQQSSEEIVEKILIEHDGGLINIFAPVIRGKKGEHSKIFDDIRRNGFAKVRLDDKILSVQDDIKIDKRKKHSIDILVDSIKISPEEKRRLGDSVETALKIGSGLIEVEFKDKKNSKSASKVFSEKYACNICGMNIAELEPRMFSFNSPYGACPDCGGLGTKMKIDTDLVIPDFDKTLNSGAIAPLRRGGKGYLMYYKGLLREFAYQRGFDMDTPFRKLPKDVQDAILYGSSDVVWGKPFEGVTKYLERLFSQTESEYLRQELNNYMSPLACTTCKGKRLKPEALSVRIENKTIIDVTQMSITLAQEFFNNLKLNKRDKSIAEQILKEISQRLNFLVNVGLDYLTLDRISSTLSGGEAQRIRLATQLGAGLIGVLYVLDEPSIGLHQRDNRKLLHTLSTLRDLGNTLIVVEHDEETIRSADFIVDLGPGAGKHGGYVVASGTLKEVLTCKNSPTAQYLNGTLKIEIPQKRRPYKDRKNIEIIGASEHNLKNINVKIPLGLFISISGVSGSGKSTLVDEILYRALAGKLYGSKAKPGQYKSITGVENIDKVIVVDQTPIGRTPRSNPATYTGIFGFIRDIFSKLPEARLRGYKPGRFSFNIKGGRCEACQGDGIKKIEMHFLPDVYVNCEVCQGKRFNSQTLDVKYKGRSICDVLNMTVDDAMELFENIPAVYNKLSVLNDVGLGYIEIGQPATTLSGGEAQRIKLSSELGRRATGRTLYILDEPTTGLHFADVKKLIDVLGALVENGNTVLVIEHNLDVLKSSDYIIDLGPNGGQDGGRIVAQGTPEEVAETKGSYTGEYLKNVL